MGPLVSFPSLLELPKSYRFVIPGITNPKVTDTVTDFFGEVANTGYQRQRTQGSLRPLCLKKLPVAQKTSRKSVEIASSRLFFQTLKTYWRLSLQTFWCRRRRETFVMPCWNVAPGGKNETAKSVEGHLALLWLKYQALLPRLFKGVHTCQQTMGLSGDSQLKRLTWTLFQGEIIYAPPLPLIIYPPPPSFFGQRAFLRGGEGRGGCIFWPPPGGRNFIRPHPPLFIHPPPLLEGSFPGGGGVSNSLRLQWSYFLDPIFFLHLPESSKIRSLEPQGIWTWTWRVPNPLGANPLVAERAFPTSDYLGRTGLARCAEEMRQESVGISQ